MVYAALAVTVLILVGFIALTSRQPPPPTIAEFAPQAVDNITDAPADQSGSSGAAARVGTDDETAPAPTPVGLEAINVPRVRRCVGDPPRQIEDPQSPPCVPYWQGSNGGATHRGVTGDEIIIAVNTASNDQNQGTRVNAALAAFFNSRFEFYGRRITLVPPATQDANGGTCPQRRAGAVAVVEQNRAFAFLGRGGSQNACFYDEAARIGLLVAESGSFVAERELQAARPYLWQYSTSVDEMFRHWGRWTCQRLAGKNAVYATDLTYRQQPRKLGLLVHSQQTPYGVDTTPIEQELARCGERLAFKDVAYANDGETQSFEAQTANAIVKMRSQGITTVLTATGVIAATSVPATATAQGYYPEWVLNDGMSRNWIVETYWTDSSQRQSLLAFMTATEQLPYPDVPLNWALSEADPGFTISSTSITLHANLTTYWSLLLLASGIQMAGPQLTPVTFERGLHRAMFPNPSAPPLQQGWVGFQNGAHSMIHDATAAWWSDAAPSPYPDEGVGAWCYARGGRRYKIDEWTKGPDELFEGACHTSPAGLR